MEIIIKGEMKLDDISKAVIEKLKEVEVNLAIHHSNGASLYIHPVNEHGEKVVPHNGVGHEIKKLYSTGPYRSIADDYKI